MTKEDRDVTITISEDRKRVDIEGPYDDRLLENLAGYYTGAYITLDGDPGNCYQMLDMATGPTKTYVVLRRDDDTIHAEGHHINPFMPPAWRPLGWLADVEVCAHLNPPEFRWAESKKPLTDGESRIVGILAMKFGFFGESA
jgi:hypothetical protein